ncbi:hypothetical protein [Methanoregula sp.]|uniref:hypothetical protein n=1 Tax=Methanoregula sp. TaxID=2052170 RepID=UPI00356A462B
MFSAPHTATLRSRKQQFVLEYDNGTAAFTAGKTLTGATSHATAVIVSTGSIASGSLQVHTVTGTFLNDEPISDNGTVPGAAVVNGVIAEAFDITGELIYSDIDAAISCRFYSQKDAVQQAGQTLYIVTTQRVMIPATSTPVNGDQIITTASGYAGTYQIGNVSPAPGLAGGPHHWTCDLAKGGA